MKIARGHSKYRFVATALLVPLLSAACEREPDVSHPQSYRRDGISFNFPRNWSVTEDVDEVAFRYLFVESPGNALVILQCYKLGTDMSIEEFSAEFHRQSLAETKNLVRLGPVRPFDTSSGSAISVRSVVAGNVRDGVEQSFSVSLLDERVPHTFRAFKVENTPAVAAFVVVQASDEDWDLVSPGFDLVLESLEFE